MGTRTQVGAQLHLNTNQAAPCAAPAAAFLILHSSLPSWVTEAPRFLPLRPAGNIMVRPQPQADPPPFLLRLLGPQRPRPQLVLLDHGVRAQLGSCGLLPDAVSHGAVPLHAWELLPFRRQPAPPARLPRWRVTTGEQCPCPAGVHPPARRPAPPLLPGVLHQGVPSCRCTSSTLSAAAAAAEGSV